MIQIPLGRCFFDKESRGVWAELAPIEDLDNIAHEFGLKWSDDNRGNGGVCVYGGEWGYPLDPYLIGKRTAGQRG